MKKAATGCFAVTCVIALLVTILASMGYMRQEKIRDSAPLTVEDIDRLSSSFNKTAPTAAEETQPSAAHPAEAPASQQDVHAELPHKLNRCATEEDRRMFFMQGKSRADKFIGYVISSPVGAIGDTVALVAGISAGAAWERGQANLFQGRWAEGRMYMEEVLRKSDNPAIRQQACGYLAWLVDDPALAAKYMEMASADDGSFGLSSSATLARATGSDELADYYRKRHEEKVRDHRERRD